MTQTAVEMRQQKQVKVYDINLMRQGVIDVYRSLIWTRKYYEAGTVELHAALNSKNLKLLQKGNIVTMTGSVESAIISGMAADDFSNEITATGNMLSAGLSRRGIKTVVNAADTPSSDLAAQTRFRALYWAKNAVQAAGYRFKCPTKIYIHT